MPAAGRKYPLALIMARDKALEARRATRPDTDIFAARSIGTLSETAIDVTAQQAALHKALARE